MLRFPIGIATRESRRTTSQRTRSRAAPVRAPKKLADPEEGRPGALGMGLWAVAVELPDSAGPHAVPAAPSTRPEWRPSSRSTNDTGAGPPTGPGPPSGKGRSLGTRVPLPTSSRFPPGPSGTARCELIGSSSAARRPPRPRALAAPRPAARGTAARTARGSRAILARHPTASVTARAVVLLLAISHFDPSFAATPGALQRAK